MNPEMLRCPVIIIGGSLAGAACARELASNDIEVVAFERDDFPREKVCGEFLSPGAIKCLNHLGIHYDAISAGAVEIRRAHVRGLNSEFIIPFDPPGLAISRKKLDFIVSRHPAVRSRNTVLKVEKLGAEFLVTGLDHKSNLQFEVITSAIVDAAGKLSRFTKRRAVEQFGLQSHEPGVQTDTIDFWFFNGAYGGTISVEGNQKNICYLVNKDVLQEWLEKRQWLVTGPVAYERVPGPYVTIGDASGMVDPFCGDGIHHALYSGILAGQIIADGLRQQRTYEDIRLKYENEWRHRWSRKRHLASMLRIMIRHQRLARAGFAIAHSVPAIPRAFLRAVWR